MPNILQSEIPKPKSWDEFEDIVADLYARAWGIRVERYGRFGQAQQGVDVYGRLAYLNGGYVGIQCKRYEDGTLTKAKVEEEIAKAETFEPALAEYIIATTEHRDAKLQKAVRQITETRRAAGKFPVSVVFWEDLCSQLADNVDLLQKHYGDLFRIFASSRSIPLQRPPRAEHFIGREKELQKLLADLQPGQVVTLCGSGGIGKSALAAEAIWTLAPDNGPPARFPDGIITHNFYNQPQVALALEAIARAYGEDPRPTPAEAARRALSGRKALLLLDGTENADNLQAVLDVRDGCGVLITSRTTRDAVSDWQAITSLPPGKAVELLQAWGKDCAADESAAVQICKLVGHLPLAVRLVGRYLAQRRQEASAYLAWLQSSPLQALNQGERREESVPLLLERSLSQVSTLAQDALAVIGVLALAPFDSEVIAKALNIPIHQANHRLGELVSYGILIRPQERYEVSHALIHTYTNQQHAPSQEIFQQIMAYYDSLVGEQSELGRKGYARLDDERAHIMAVLATCTEREAWESARSLVWAIDDHLDIRGHWTERVQALDAGIAAAQEMKHRRDEGAFLNNLGNAYSALGQVEKAIAHYEEALVIAREIGDRRNEGILTGNLGTAYSDLEQVEKAIQYYEQGLVIAQEVGDRQAEGTNLGNLGTAYSVLGEARRGTARRGMARRAIAHHEWALSIDREIGDRRGEGEHLGNLGLAYRVLGLGGEAMAHYRKALAIAREIGDQRREGTHSWNLGLLYEESDPAQAAKLMQVLVDYKREIGHPDAETDAARVQSLLARLGE